MQQGDHRTPVAGAVLGDEILPGRVAFAGGRPGTLHRGNLTRGIGDLQIGQPAAFSHQGAQHEVGVVPPHRQESGGNLRIDPGIPGREVGGLGCGLLRS